MYQEGNWLSLVEYSHLSRISISTLRRMIKRNELKFKEDHGKYYIYSKIESSESKHEINELRIQLKKVISENHELKMLVDLYENKTREIKLPELPIC